MKLSKSFILFLFVPICVFSGDTSLCSYFKYCPADINTLCYRQSEYTMCAEELQKWDEVAEKAIEKEDLSWDQARRIYVYLAIAQAEAAYLSCRAKGCLVGSLDPVSSDVLGLFLRKYERPKDYVEDSYSRKLAEIVMTQIQWRVQREEARTDEYVLSDGEKKVYTEAWGVAKWIPWNCHCPCDFWPAPPPGRNSCIWKQQLAAIKQAQGSMTKEEKKAVEYWAGRSGPGSGDWRKIVDDYLYCRCGCIPCAKILKVRAVFASAAYDGTIVCFGSKYNYMVVRPKVRDPSIEYLIPLPGHPSYPAGHSSEAAIGSTIMCSFFPRDTAHWRRLASQSGYSRVCAGVHHPIEIEMGKESGTRVAQHALFR